MTEFTAVKHISFCENNWLAGGLLVQQEYMDFKRGICLLSHKKISNISLEKKAGNMICLLFYQYRIRENIRGHS